MTSGAVALELRDVHKRFGSTVALDGASLSVHAGTLHALLGENGAGKTSLLNIAAGLISPESGSLIFKGTAVRWRSPADALIAGVSAVHQHFSLVPAMTVAENIALADRRLFKPFSARAATARVRAIAADAGLAVDPEAVVANLPVAAQQRVEIIKAIANDPEVLILDEPTAVLSPPEADDLFLWLRTFVNRGRTVIVITHKIREAMQNADAVTVLRAGRTTLDAPIGSTNETDVLQAILGGTISPQGTWTPDRSSSRSMGPAVLELRDATISASAGSAGLAPISLTAHAGEILGVAGVDGAGQHDLLRLLAGRRQPDSGTAALPDIIGFVPEDRLRDAIVPELSLMENFALRGANLRDGIIRWRDVAATTDAATKAFDVRAQGAHAPASSLSGGNQQKLVLARELEGSPHALVAENPTRGLDVRATADILARIQAARNRGTAVVMYSSDIDELLSVADRVVACYAGTVVPVPLDAAAIGRAMVGAR